MKNHVLKVGDLVVARPMARLVEFGESRHEFSMILDYNLVNESYLGTIIETREGVTIFQGLVTKISKVAYLVFYGDFMKTEWYPHESLTHFQEDSYEQA